MTNVAAAMANVTRHHARQHENSILRDRFHPSMRQWFDIAEEVRLIRLRDAEADLSRACN